MAEFFKNAGDLIRNYGLSSTDTALTAVGASNVVQDSDYKGTGSEIGKGYANIVGGVGKTVLPVALQSVGVPMQATSAAQQAIGAFNPEAEGMQQPVAPVQPYYNGMNSVPQMTYAQNYAYGGYVKGKVGCYADGGVVGYNGTSPFGQGGNYGIPSGTGYSISPTQQIGNFNESASNSSGLNPYIAAGTLALGALQTIQGYRGLNKLSKEAMPTYTSTPQLTSAYNRAQQAAQRGYTPEQEAAFKSNLATSQNTAYKNAVSQSGGNLAQAINAGLQSQNINALNQFAADDASKRQQNVQYADSFAPRFQNIQDENTRNALNYRMMREQALGNAVSQGQTNLATGLNAGLASLYKG